MAVVIFARVLLVIFRASKRRSVIRSEADRICNDHRIICDLLTVFVIR